MDYINYAQFFERYSQKIAAYPQNGNNILQELILAEENEFCVVYAPFDHMPSHAALVIVGITPGITQAFNAIAAASTALRAGCDHTTASRAAKLTGSFSGPMRSNLIEMLDRVGLATLMGIESCDALFDPMQERTHFTSALRYPVLKNGKNYSGGSEMLVAPILKGMVDRCLTDEARRLSSAIWLPLGKHPERILSYLCRRGTLDRAQVLDGLPHPSGANAERIAYFTGRKRRSHLSAKTNPDALDSAREKLVTKIASLRSRPT